MTSSTKKVINRVKNAVRVIPVIPVWITVYTSLLGFVAVTTARQYVKELIK